MSNTRVQMNDFFISVQARALRQAELAVGDRDEALDILQDAMIRLAKHYSDKEQEWPLLFQRILQNLIRDWYRRKKVRSILTFWQRQEMPTSSASENADLQINEEPLPGDRALLESQAPHKNMSQLQIAENIKRAVATLPFRQQQAFTLRAWLGHNTEETAYAMGCSTGSVKTHYSRAIAKLRELLEEVKDEQVF